MSCSWWDGSGGSELYGSSSLDDLLGGSSGGSSESDGSGAGGGAIYLRAGHLLVNPIIVLQREMDSGLPVREVEDRST